MASIIFSDIRKYHEKYLNSFFFVEIVYESLEPTRTYLWEINAVNGKQPILCQCSTSYLSFNVWCTQNGSATSWSFTYNSRRRFTKYKAMDKIVFSARIIQRSHLVERLKGFVEALKILSKDPELLKLAHDYKIIFLKIVTEPQHLNYKQK